MAGIFGGGGVVDGEDFGWGYGAVLDLFYRKFPMQGRGAQVGQLKGDRSNPSSPLSGTSCAPYYPRPHIILLAS
jgi:hypothetical protein